MSPPWMPLYIRDYLADTQHLTAEQHGAYLLLLMNQWQRGSLPNDDHMLARMTRVHPPHWPRVKKVLSSYFVTQEDGSWISKRLALELTKTRELSNKRKAAAEHLHSKSGCKTEVVSQQLHPHSPSHSQKKKEKDILDDRGAMRPIDSQFQEFWNAYPRRDGSNPKAPAEKKFVAACKAGVDPSTIIESARRYATKLGNQVGTPYVMQAATWLNRKCWNDYASERARDPSNPYLNPEHPRHRDWLGGWRPGMPTREEIYAKQAERERLVQGGNGIRQEKQ